MEFDYLNKKDSRGLVKDLFKLSFTKEDLPFETIILPLGFNSITFIFNKQKNLNLYLLKIKTIFQNLKKPLSSL